MQKKYTTDTLPFKKKLNNGERDQYFMPERVPAIIDREAFDAVADLIQKRKSNDISELKNKKSLLMEKQQSDSAANKRIQDAVRLLNNSSAEVTEWDEGMIRQLLDYVKVLAEDRVLICLRGGIEVERFVEKG